MALGDIMRSSVAKAKQSADQREASRQRVVDRANNRAPADQGSYITTNEAASWNGQSYAPGQRFDVSDWDQASIKNFRDQYDSDFFSDDWDTAFNQYSLDNLGGMSQYEFQTLGVDDPERARDAWALASTSPELNRWYEGYDIGLGDYDAGAAFYDYYMDKNNLSEVDPFSDYEVMGDIAGNNLDALRNFTQGYLEDASDFAEDGSFDLDRKKSQDIDPATLAEPLQGAYQSFNLDASNKGVAGDKETDGEVNQEASGVYEKMQNAPLIGGMMPDADPSMFRERELGRLYDEPQIDPDIRPRDMWSLDDINEIALDTGMIPVFEYEGDTENLPRWMASDVNENSVPFEYTKGALDNAPTDMSLEAFDSATSLLGDDVQRTFLTDENGVSIEYPFGDEDMRTEANVIINGVRRNPVDEEGNFVFGRGPTGWLDYIPKSATDEFVMKEAQPGGVLSGPIIEGWTPVSELVAAYDWGPDEVRTYAASARGYSAFGEDWAIDQANMGRAIAPYLENPPGENFNPFSDIRDKFTQIDPVTLIRGDRPYVDQLQRKAEEDILARGGSLQSGSYQMPDWVENFGTNFSNGLSNVVDSNLEAQTIREGFYPHQNYYQEGLPEDRWQELLQEGR